MTNLSNTKNTNSSSFTSTCFSKQQVSGRFNAKISAGPLQCFVLTLLSQVYDAQISNHVTI